MPDFLERCPTCNDPLEEAAASAPCRFVGYSGLCRPCFLRRAEIVRDLIVSNGLDADAITYVEADFALTVVHTATRIVAAERRTVVRDKSALWGLRFEAGCVETEPELRDKSALWGLRFEAGCVETEPEYEDQDKEEEDDA